MASFSLQEADADELVADTFIAYWKYGQHIEREHEITRWLVGVLRNKIVDKIRYYNTPKKRSIISHPWMAEDESLNHVEDPLSVEIDYKKELIKALIILTPMERKIINLTMCGMSIKEICNELSSKYQNVINQKHSATNKLRNYFSR